MTSVKLIWMKTMDAAGQVLLTIVFSAVTSSVCSQALNATTEDGKKVMLHSDGKWEYVTGKTDSITISNNCSEYVFDQVDRMNGRRMIMAPKEPMTLTANYNSGIRLRWLLIEGTMVLSLTAVEGNCVDEGSDVNILFNDGTRLSMSNGSKFNCDGRAGLFFGDMYGKRKQLDEIASKLISAIRVVMVKSFIEVDLTENEARILQQSLLCLKDKL